MGNAPLKVLVWDENKPHIEDIYPGGIRQAVADAIAGDDVEVSIGCIDDADQGVPDSLLNEIDVIVWWGHARHGEVEDALAARIKEQVHTRGLGFICLHSGHYSKPFKAVLDATGHLKGGWREADDSEEITVCAKWHPIAAGVEDFVLAEEEMYGAPFGVPPHEALIFQSYFPKDGSVFPCGLVWTVGEGIDPEFTSGNGSQSQGKGIGRVFYFRPGHESYPTYFNESVKKVIYNAVRWAGKITG